MVIHDVQNIPENDRPALNDSLFDITRLGIVTKLALIVSFLQAQLTILFVYKRSEERCLVCLLLTSEIRIFACHHLLLIIVVQVIIFVRFFII